MKGQNPWDFLRQHTKPCVKPGGLKLGTMTYTLLCPCSVRPVGTFHPRAADPGMKTLHESLSSGFKSCPALGPGPQVSYCTSLLLPSKREDSASYTHRITVRRKLDYDVLGPMPEHCKCLRNTHSCLVIITVALILFFLLLVLAYPCIMNKR